MKLCLLCFFLFHTHTQAESVFKRSYIIIILFGSVCAFCVSLFSEFSFFYIVFFLRFYADYKCLNGSVYEAIRSKKYRWGENLYLYKSTHFSTHATIFNMIPRKQYELKLTI